MPRGGLRRPAGGRPIGAKDKKPRKRRDDKYSEFPAPIEGTLSGRELEKQLLAHLGGTTVVTLRLIVEEAVQLKLQLDGLRRKRFEGTMTDADAAIYERWLRAYLLCLKEIGHVKHIRIDDGLGGLIFPSFSG
jgi:hypothetical protein